MISVQNAKQLIQQRIRLMPVHYLSLSDALNYVLAENVYALVDVPPFDNAAMDGYALVFNPGQIHYGVTEKIQAGSQMQRVISENEVVRIFTGAMMPPGADTVIQQELAFVNDRLVTFDLQTIKQGSNVRIKGSQNKKNDLLAQAGAVITPGLIALLASAGIHRVGVHKKPSVAVIVTGNELQNTGTPLQTGCIYNSNEPAVCAFLKQTGIERINCFSVPDSKEVLLHTVQKAMSDNDVVILTGGISVGDYDFVKEVMMECQVETLFYKINQKPGKPMFAGVRDHVFLFALPGNPSSVVACFNQYVKPYLLSVCGHANTFKADASLISEVSYNKKRGLTHFLKGFAHNNSVTILPGQDSFNLLPFNKANCLIELEESVEHISAGALVNVYYL